VQPPAGIFENQRKQYVRHNAPPPPQSPGALEGGGVFFGYGHWHACLYRKNTVAR